MFQRGFKAWCEKAASQYRKELGFAELDPIDPYDLAKHLGVQVWMANEIPGVKSETLEVLLKKEPDSWSAITLQFSHKFLVIMNPTHSKKRQRNDLMHELSHIILKHKPNRIDVTRDGLLILKNYEKTQEEEADWLAGCLLLPRKLLLQVVKQRNSMEQTSDNLGVSVALLKYRINVTGISRQMARGS